MPRVIFKCPYLKGGGSTAAHRRYYVKYIATRDGVEKMDDTRKLLPATGSQEKLIAQLLRDFPDTREMFEYEDYLRNPTRGNASELITAVLDQNLPLLDKRENYIKYIATRPRAERSGDHGLFTSAGTPVVLARIADTVAEHPGNVWTPIISLRREDAARLGYDNAANWQAFLSSYAEQMAKNMKIKPDNFHWYAAYHDEGHHPHIHMVCWSSDPREGFLTKDGIRGIKSGLAGRIFRQELMEVYQEQTQRRDELMAAARERMAGLVEQMQSGVLHNENIEQLTAHLAQRLRFHSGKKQYGYLKPPLKAVVDEIVSELEKDPRIAEAYRLWCDMRLEVLGTYLKEPEHPGPLSRQKELRRILNIVIEEAAILGGQEVAFDRPDAADELFPSAPRDDSPADLPDTDADDAPEPEMAEPEDAEPRVDWSDQYRQAKRYLYGSEETPRDFDMAFRLFHEEALAGNALAMHDLARMYADALVPETEAERAGGEMGPASRWWYVKALAAFLAVEDVKPGRYTEYRIGKMYAAGLGTEQDHSEAAGWFRESADQGYKYAQYSLAGLYYRGKGIEQDYEAALGLYTKSAAQEFPYASYELGKMYRDGVGTVKNDGAAGSHFRDAYHGFTALERQSHDDKLQYRLGWMLEKGVGTGQDIPAAMEFYEKAAGVGNPHAQYALAKLILKDPAAAPERAAEAVAMLEKSAEAGNGTAVYALAKLYRDGSENGAVEKDVPKAMALFTKAAEEFENEHASYALGKLYQEGKELPRDIPAAVRWLEKSAEMGNQHALYRLGKLYLSGEDIPKDVGKAVRCFLAAAEQGNQFAQYALGMLYLKGEDAPKDVPAAAALLEKAALQDNEYAQYQLAKLYLSGDGLPKNPEKAVRWFSAAAEQGNQFAQYALGMLYLKGEDAPKDMTAAAALLEKAALQDNEYAAYQLGKLYLSGDGVSKDAEKALHWLTKSAEAGNQYAQYILGKLLLMGKDVPRDREAALKWLTLSAEQGNIYAQFFIDHFDEFKDPSAFMMASRLLHHMGNIFRDNTPPPGSGSGGMATDRKLLCKLREKKIAQGHAADDHAQTMQY